MYCVKYIINFFHLINWNFSPNSQCPCNIENVLKIACPLMCIPGNLFYPWRHITFFKIIIYKKTSNIFKIKKITQSYFIYYALGQWSISNARYLRSCITTVVCASCTCDIRLDTILISIGHNKTQNANIANFSSRSIVIILVSCVLYIFELLDLIYK